MSKRTSVTPALAFQRMVETVKNLTPRNADNKLEAAKRYANNNIIMNCLLVIAFLSGMTICTQLSSILVPLLFAFFLCYICDPIVDLLTKYPNERCCMRCCLTRQRKETFQNERDLSLHYSPPSPVLSNPPVPHPQSQDEDGDNREGRGIHRIASTSSMSSRSDVFEADMLPVPCRFCLRCFHFPRPCAVIVCLLMLVGFLILFGYIVAVSVKKLASNIDGYEYQAQEIVDWVKKELKSLGIDFSTDIVPKLKEFLGSLAGDITQWALSFIEDTVLVLIFLAYLLISPIRPKHGVAALANHSVRKYIQLKTLISLLVGICVGLSYTILNVDLAWVWALITFVMNFIPNVGSIIATLLPMPLVILSPPDQMSVTSKFLALLLPISAHMIVGNYIEPLIFGRSLDIHPIVVLIALGFWSILWGIPGMILSVPIVAITRIVLCTSDHPLAQQVVRILEGKLIDKYSGLSVEELLDRTVVEEPKITPINITAKYHHQQQQQPDHCVQEHGNLKRLNPVSSSSSSSNGNAPSSFVF